MRPLTTAVDPANASEQPAPLPFSINSLSNLKVKKKTGQVRLVLKYFIHLVEVLIILIHLTVFYPFESLKRRNRVRLLNSIFIWVPRNI